MAPQNTSIVSFNSGEITPLLDARCDFKKYESSCRTLQNMIPRIYGPAIRRPGTEYIGQTRDSANKSILVPFEFSSVAAYVCEVSAGYIQFYYSGSLLCETADTSFAGTISSSGTTVTFTEAADAIKAGYDASDPKLGAYIVADGITVQVRSWTSSTVCVVDVAPYPAWDGDTITSTQVPVQVLTPYLEADLFELQFKQINDVMVITHQDYPPATMSRVSATSFEYTVLQEADTPTHTFTGGPFLEENTDDTITITPSGYEKDTTIDLVASEAMFDALHVGSLWKLRHEIAALSVGRTAQFTADTYSDTISVRKGQQLNYSIATDSSWIGVMTLQKSTDDGSTWQDQSNFLLEASQTTADSITNGEDDALYRWYVTAWTQGIAYTWLSTLGCYISGIVQIATVSDSENATAVVIDALGGTGATYKWSEGAWSDYRGWPRTMTLYQQRAIYGGSTTYNQRVWISKTDDYYDFEAGTGDDDAFVLEIASEKKIEIQWLSTKNGVAIGTTGGILRLSGSVNNPRMTPTNFDINAQSVHESAGVQALLANSQLIFIDKTCKHLYELDWDDLRQAYTEVRLTLLCEQLAAGGITDYWFQKSPEPIIWFVTAESPYLFSLTYDRDQDVIAGARHPLGGDGIVESGCRIPGETEDEIWLLVKRTVNSVDVRYIERLKPWSYGDQEDAFFVDCGLSYSGAAASEASGLDYLEGEEVAILADGVVYPNADVSDGSVSIGDDTATKITVGLPYTYLLKPMRFDASPTSRGSMRRVTRIVASFYESLAVKYGKDADNLFDVEFPMPMTYGSQELFTGDLDLPFDSEFSDSDELIITGSGPMPCSLRCLNVYMDRYA